LRSANRFEIDNDAHNFILFASSGQAKAACGKHADKGESSMKKPTWILLAVLMAVVAAAGQESAAGIKVGPILSLAGEGSMINDASNLLSLRGGLFYRRKISSVLSIQPEIQVALKGARYYSVYWRSTESVHFNYLEIPVLLNAWLVGDTLEIFAGPYGALLLGKPPLDAAHDWTWRENELESYDFGACLGARIWWRNFSLELQFSRGFVNVLPQIDVPESEAGHFNTAFALLVGYRL